MICGHLDNADLDDNPINFARLELNYMLSMTVRHVLVAQMLGAQSSDDAIIRSQEVTAMNHPAHDKEPIGL